jgi:NAD(P)-dependent dehydrogenase (short-subunit alcohol dehydrogenase family)
MPSGGFGKPKEIGNLVRFLVSLEAEYITGAIYQIDGELWQQ